MQVTNPALEVWKKLQKDFKYDCKRNKELKKQKYSSQFEIEDPILFYYQLENANEMIPIDFDLIEIYLEQIPKLLFALKQNVSTVISMLILDLLIQLLEITDFDASDLIVENFGLKIFLERIQDKNIDIVRKCTKIIKMCFDEDQLLQVGAFDILIDVLDRLDSNSFCELNLINVIINLCKASKSQTVNIQGCIHILQLRNLSIANLIVELNRLLHYNLFQNRLALLLVKYNFIDRINHIANNLNIFYILYVLAKHIKNQEYFLQHNILISYEVQLDSTCPLANIYAKTLSILCEGNQQFTQNIIKNRIILRNLFQFKNTDCVVSLVEICNNVMDLKLSFELQYLMTIGILYRYFTLLNNSNISNQILALLGLKELAKLNHLDNQLNSVQKQVCKLQNSHNNEVNNLCRDLLSEIRKQKESYF